MNISQNIIDYLNKSNWNLVFNEETLLHYTKEKNFNIYHLYIQRLTNCNEYEVELGIGETQDNSEIFKLRNIISVLKRRDL